MNNASCYIWYVKKHIEIYMTQEMQHSKSLYDPRQVKSGFIASNYIKSPDQTAQMRSLIWNFIE